MWSLGKVSRSPEVCRVYIGSFNGLNPIREDVNPNCVPLFQKEQVLQMYCLLAISHDVGSII